MVDQTRLVEVLPERVGSVSSPHFPHNLDDGQDYSWSLDSFKKSFQAKITRKSDWRIEFDLIGLDASIANAIRRVLLAEVPTVAIEQVFVFNNTSIIVDEVLSHRLGLVPIKVDPERIDDRPEGVTPTDRNTLVFKLDVECTRISDHPDIDESEQIENLKVLSSALEWDPKGTQAEDFADDPPKPVQSDILLAKLRPGQAIKMELHCVKGIGKDHAKFSPVSTASYRLLPHIDIPDPSAIEPEDIQKFVTCFPPGVIGVRKHKDTGHQEVFVKNPRKDTVSREVLRYKEFEGKVKLGRIRDHFLFDLESSGVIPPQKLMPAAIKVLKEKIRAVRNGVDQLEQQYAHIPQR